jgi:hypothetical protein
VQSLLASELRNDPEGLGYAEHLPGDPQRVYDLLTAQSFSMVGPLRSTTAKAWAAMGPYAKIYDASLDTSNPCRAACLVIRDSFACGDPIHLEDPRLQAMLRAWVQHEIATQEEVDGLYALATIPASRVEKLGIPAPSNSEILAAWSEE